MKIQYTKLFLEGSLGDSSGPELQNNRFVDKGYKKEELEELRCKISREYWEVPAMRTRKNKDTMFFEEVQRDVTH